MLLHEFYLADSNGQNYEQAQIINMMNVNYTARIDKTFGMYGSSKVDYAFKPILDLRVSETKDVTKDSGDFMYRGMIMKYDKQRYLRYTAYSMLDLISASGGIITGLLTLASPIAKTFSKLAFELGIMRLLFMAKTYK